MIHGAILKINIKCDCVNTDDKETCRMGTLPKLKILNVVNDMPYEICEIERGKDLPFCEHALIIVEDQVIRSYEELIQLAAKDCNKDKKFLEVKILEVIYGG